MVELDPTPRQMLIEASIFWAIGIVLFFGRIWSRSIAFGSIRNLKADDYIMCVAVAFWTALLVLLQISSRYSTNLYPASEEAAILANPQDVKNRIYGSKITICVEQCMLAAIWSVKICLLLLYNRMTTNLRENRFVKIMMGYVAVGYIVQQICYFGVWCRPFSQYWAVPTVNSECADYSNYSIMGAVFNLSSDALMLLIPLPLIWRAHMKLKKKLLLCGVFSLGLFVMLAAILNKYYNFALPGQTVYMLWYIRESSTSIFVSNLACWWPLLRKILGLKSFEFSSQRYRSPSYILDAAGGPLTDAEGKGTRITTKGKSSRSSRSRHSRNVFSRMSHRLGESRTFNTLTSMTTTRHDRSMRRSRNGSEEAINDVPLEIWQKVDFDIENLAVPTSSTEVATAVAPGMDGFGAGMAGDNMGATDRAYVATVTAATTPNDRRLSLSSSSDGEGSGRGNHSRSESRTGSAGVSSSGNAQGGGWSRGRND